MLKHDVLRDLLVQEDLGLVKDMVEEAEEEDVEERAFRRTLQKHVHSTFKKVLPEEEWELAEEEYKAATMPKQFVPLEVFDGDLQIIDKLGPPPPARIRKNKAQGLYTVLYQGDYVRSYSWSWIRTPPEALQLSLRRAWSKYTQKEHIEAPDRIMLEIDAVTERANTWKP